MRALVMALVLLAVWPMAPWLVGAVFVFVATLWPLFLVMEE